MKFIAKIGDLAHHLFTTMDGEVHDAIDGFFHILTAQHAREAERAGFAIAPDEVAVTGYTPTQTAAGTAVMTDTSPIVQVHEIAPTDNPLQTPAYVRTVSATDNQQATAGAFAPMGMNEKTHDPETTDPDDKLKTVGEIDGTTDAGSRAIVQPHPNDSFSNPVRFGEPHAEGPGSDSMPATVASAAPTGPLSDAIAAGALPPGASEVTITTQQAPTGDGMHPADIAPQAQFSASTVVLPVGTAPTGDGSTSNVVGGMATSNVAAEQPPADDAFVAIGATRFSDGKVQTQQSLADAQTAYAAAHDTEQQSL